MPVTQNKPGPYAPASAILEVATRYRDRGLPTPVNAEVLARAGISESLIPRTLQALQTLDLIGKDGVPTQTLEGLRLAPEAEFQQRLADWLRGAYAEVFAFVDPTKDDVTGIRDAFRGYDPIGQQERMVSLFQGLCTAAGLVPKKSAKPPATQYSPGGASAGTPRQRTNAKRMVVERFKDVPRRPSGLPAPLAGLLESLPADGDVWTPAARAKFITAFTAILDFCFPTATENEAEPGGH